jgi:hypothetical protein
VFRHCRPANSTNQALLLKSAGERIAGVPNTLPLHGLTGVLSLAASDVYPAEAAGMTLNLLPETRDKTSLYSMLGVVGQSEVGS